MGSDDAGDHEDTVATTTTTKHVSASPYAGIAGMGEGKVCPWPGHCLCHYHCQYLILTEHQYLRVYVYKNAFCSKQQSVRTRGTASYFRWWFGAGFGFSASQVMRDRGIGVTMHSGSRVRKIS